MNEASAKSGLGGWRERESTLGGVQMSVYLYLYTLDCGGPHLIYILFSRLLGTK